MSRRRMSESPSDLRRGQETQGPPMFVKRQFRSSREAWCRGGVRRRSTCARLGGEQVPCGSAQPQIRDELFATAPSRTSRWSQPQPPATRSCSTAWSWFATRTRCAARFAFRPSRTYHGFALRRSRTAGAPPQRATTGALKKGVEQSTTASIALASNLTHETHLKQQEATDQGTLELYLDRPLGVGACLDEVLPRRQTHRS